MIYHYNYSSIFYNKFSLIKVVIGFIFISETTISEFVYYNFSFKLIIYSKLNNPSY